MAFDEARTRETRHELSESSPQIVTTPPAHPKIYHITHMRNLPLIIEAGVLWSDAKRIELELDCDVVGMSHIKRRRLEEIEVSCHAGTFVGHYAPFYFCPRSIMLYLLHRGNSPDLTYKGGQQPIVHLQADLHTVVEWAKAEGRKWAFSTGNAGARYVKFFKSRQHLEKLNWPAIQATQWSASEIKEAKQAEFLLYDSFAWELVEKIGVCNQAAFDEVTMTLEAAGHRPELAIERGWYY